MKSPKLRRLLNTITGLSAPECLEALDAVHTRATQIKSAVMEEQITEAVKACPHCGHTALKKAGSKGGRRRFRCGGCRRSFNAFTGTPFARLRKFEKRVDYAGAMLQRMTLSIRKAASRLKINPKTAFRWRHRLLDGVRNLQPSILRGLVEADETYFRQSFKGSRHLPPGRKAKKRGTPAGKRGLSKEQVPVLVARDRSSGETLAQVVESRFEVHIKQALLPHLASDSILCTDGASVYRRIAKATGIALQSTPKKEKAGVYHIQNVNAYDSHLKRWIRFFNGVATRYLPNYIGWFRFMERTDDEEGCLLLEAALAAE